MIVTDIRKPNHKSQGTDCCQYQTKPCHEVALVIGTATDEATMDKPMAVI